MAKKKGCKGKGSKGSNSGSVKGANSTPSGQK